MWPLASGAASFPPITTSGLYPAASREAEGQTRSSQRVFWPPGAICCCLPQAEPRCAYPCGVSFRSKLEVTAGKCPFLPSNGLWPLLVTGFLVGNSNEHAQAPAYPARRRLVPALPCLGWHPALCQLVPGVLGCCQVMVTWLEKGVLRAVEPGCCSAPRATRGLGASGWMQPPPPPQVGCGEAPLWLGRGFCSLWGETRSPPRIVEVAVVPLQPRGHWWPTGIPGARRWVGLC